MAPDITHDDAPSGPGVRILIGLAIVVAVCAALAGGFYEVVIWLSAHHAGTGALFAATAIYAALILLVVILWMRSKTVNACMIPTEAGNRYRRRMSFATCAYVGTLLLAITAYKELHIEGPLAYVAALLPALPLSGMFVSMGLYLREETDEFQRQVQVESSLWATGGVLILCAGWGFLEMFGLAPHVEAWVLVPVWALFLGVANLFIRRRYR
jgi:hypothetical protein